MKNVRLIGGETAKSLRVIDCETGLPIAGVTRLVLTVGPEGTFCEVTQIMHVVGLDVGAMVTAVDVVNSTGPKKQVASLER